MILIKKPSRILPAVLPAILFLFTYCTDVPRDNKADKWGDNFDDIYSDNRITSFNFTDPDVNGVINEETSSIIVYVPYGTDVTSLTAEFTTNAEKVEIYGREQRSGITVNDFSESHYYTVIAQNNSYREYIVSVEIVLLARFTLSDPAINWSEPVTATIDYTLNTVTAEIPYYMNIQRLIAVFETSGDITINGISQISGISENDYSDMLIYEIINENGVSAAYNVIVTNKEISVKHFAGSRGTRGDRDGIGEAASFRFPYDISSDTDNLYVTDNNNHTIRKIEISTAAVTTLAGKAGVSGADDGTGAEARFNSPEGIVCDGKNLYICDTGSHTIRKIVIAAGIATTFAGEAGTSGLTDDASGFNDGITSKFSSPRGIATDGANLYIADFGNDRIRKIIISSLSAADIGKVSTIATINNPNAITTDGLKLYISTDNHVIYQADMNGSNTVIIAGESGTADYADGTGTDARFNYPYGITNDGTNLYICDGENYIIRQMSISTKAVTTISGMAEYSGSYDGIGIGAMLGITTGITINGGNLYIVDRYNHSIRKISLYNKMTSTFAGATQQYGYSDGVGTAARFNQPRAVTADKNFVYVSDTSTSIIRRIEISTGMTITYAGLANVPGSADGPRTGARFNLPRGIYSDGSNIYICDSGNHKIRRINTSSGIVTTIAGTGIAGSVNDPTGHSDGITSTFNYPSDIVSDGTYLYVTDTSNYVIRRITISSGVVSTIAGTGASGFEDDSDGYDGGISSKFKIPTGITTDGINIYVTDTQNHAIRKIIAATGVVSTIAGTGAAGSEDDADGFKNGLSSTFNYPHGIANDNANLYIADRANNIIRKIILSSGIVSTLAGVAGEYGNYDGNALTCSFAVPYGAAFSNGVIYISEDENNVIKTINP